VSAELEQIIKQSLDGTFVSVCWHTGKVSKNRVPVDYMPSHHARSNQAYKQSGALNGNAKPWTAELDDKLIKVRGSGLSWDDVATVMRRSPSNCRIRYKEVCEALGLKPVPNVCPSGRMKVRP
jgi:hypothetical protein